MTSLKKYTSLYNVISETVDNETNEKYKKYVISKLPRTMVSDLSNAYDYAALNTLSRKMFEKVIFR